MPLIGKVPRFRYFVPTSRLLRSLFLLPFSNMQNRSLEQEVISELSRFVGNPNVTTTSSFRMGLYYVLKSLGLPAESEVLLTPITIPDTINIIVNLGLRPKFVDMDPETQSIDMADFFRKLSKNTKAVLITHLSGGRGDLSKINEIAQKNELKIIVDISQSIDRLHDDKDQADFTICSFSRGKMATSMAGGMVISKDKTSHDRIIELKSAEEIYPTKKLMLAYYALLNLWINFATNQWIFDFVTFPFLLLLTKINAKKWHNLDPEVQVESDVFFDNVPILRSFLPRDFFCYMSDWQLNLLKEQIRDLNQRNIRRKELAQILLQELNAEVKNRIPELWQSLDRNTFYHFPLKLENNEKEKILGRMFLLGVDTAGYGLNLCTEEKVFSSFYQDCPGAHKIKHGTIFIPLHESFTEKQVRFVANVMNKIFA